jgi:hypothetical protein
MCLSVALNCSRWTIRCVHKMHSPLLVGCIDLLNVVCIDLESTYFIVRFEVFTAVTLNSAVFCDVALVDVV